MARYFLFDREAIPKTALRSHVCAGTACALFLLMHSMRITAEPPGRLITGKPSVGPLSTESVRAAAAGRRKDEPPDNLFIPLRHLRAGISAGITATGIKVNNSFNDNSDDITNKRLTAGITIRPLPFLHLKASAGSSTIAGMSAEADTSRTVSGVYYSVNSSARTGFKCYSAGANLMIPLLFWKRWPESLSNDTKGFYLALGGVREWITVTDSYSSDSLGKGSKTSLYSITGSSKERRWAVNAGFWYRHPLPVPLKGWFEAGLEYVPPYSSVVEFSGTGREPGSEESVPVSRTVQVDQRIPVQLTGAVVFNVY